VTQTFVANLREEGLVAPDVVDQTKSRQMFSS
jgi:hypothetical protein